MISISKVDSFPELTRSGRVNGELQGIIDALLASANNGDKFALSGVEPGKPYNSMQQRIRAQAKKLNLKVIIRFDAESKTLYFKASRATGAEKFDVMPMNDSEDGLHVKASDVKSIKAKNQTSNK